MFRAVLLILIYHFLGLVVGVLDFRRWGDLLRAWGVVILFYALHVIGFGVMAQGVGRGDLPRAGERLRLRGWGDHRRGAPSWGGWFWGVGAGCHQVQSLSRSGDMCRVRGCEGVGMCRGWGMCKRARAWRCAGLRACADVQGWGCAGVGTCARLRECASVV